MKNTPLNVQRILLGDLKSPQSISQLTNHLQKLYNGLIVVSMGKGVPEVPPTKISAQYIDTKNKNVYVATGNSLVTDWVKVS